MAVVFVVTGMFVVVVAGVFVVVAENEAVKLAGLLCLALAP